MNWEKFLNPDRIRPSRRTPDREIDPRNEFESDFGRVIFSPATRRMHDKTQVFPLTTDDNIHSRLTHSMEVMAIGHSLGLRVCEDDRFIEKTGISKEFIHRQIPVILKNACLVHDIGNPPFGHFGETVIANYFTNRFESGDLKLKLTEKEREDFTLFDGNAQGFRVLTKLQVLNDTAGLNLTYASLGAFLKYPNSGEKNSSFIGTSKRGVFQSETYYLQRIAEECGLPKCGPDAYMRHPLSFLMEAADSICYLTMDIEDGFNKGWFNFNDISEQLANVKNDKLQEKIGELKELSGPGAETTKMVNLRIFLISELVKIAVQNYIDNIDDICEGKYQDELIKQDSTNLTKTLADFCFDHIFQEREIEQLELTGHSVLVGLLNYYIDFIFSGNKHYVRRAKGMISDSVIRIALMETKASKFEELSDYYKLRIIVDFISGMTDQFALNHFQKLSGQKII
jgi:dGTPase